MRRHASLVLAAILLLCAVLNGCKSRHVVSSAPAVTPSAGWRSAELPFKPMDIVSNRDTLWVCGAGEMVAESKDGGESWHVRHSNENGSVLLTIGFANDLNGFAAGTDGALLLTGDGGATWTSVHTDGHTIYNASFSDERNGMIQTPSAVELTHDGGATWSQVSFLRTEQQLKNFQFVLSLAALDSNRMAILVKQGPAAYYDQRIVITKDGGKDWKTENIEHVGLGALLSQHGEYWALGIEVIDRGNHGGHSVSLVMHSADAENWTKQPRPAKEIETCTSGGCLLWNGAGVDPFGAKPSYWTFPPEKPTSAKWAVTNYAICTIVADLLCAGISPAAAVPVYTDDTPIPAVATPPALGSRKPSGLACISCPFERIIVDKEFSGRAEISLDLVIATNGTVSQVRVLHSPTPGIGARYADVAHSWIFEPTLKDGVAVPVHTEVNLNVQVIRNR